MASVPSASMLSSTAAANAASVLYSFFPTLEVAGTPFPLPAWKRPLVLAVQAAQMGGLALVVAGDHIFRQLGVAPPGWYTSHVAGNRFGAGMGVWFVGNLVTTNLQNTGAFEVYFDGRLVFSKLAEGRMPTLPELLAPMDAYFFERKGGEVGGGHGRRPAVAAGQAATLKGPLPAGGDSLD
ncbi:SelT-like protein [Tetrabaena socialis]|uniref:SelT-like protein n=1 Tax=Tetrabaena socialis TaxID=47790 RepID=A0A2J7ZXD9_9CHLO|nr:SelT-like protein [Tetrabaena socialis]|eukprot:PNH04926.1 SelT-like protein [Tetrabaena socialis]